MKKISDGSAGIYQCEEIITALNRGIMWMRTGIGGEVVENQWEVIQEFTEIIGELITEILEDKIWIKESVLLHSISLIGETMDCFIESVRRSSSGNQPFRRIKTFRDFLN